MKYLAIAWSVLLALVYVALVIGILSAAKNHFETLGLAVLIQLYAAALYNFSLMGETAEINNHAAFVRFRFLAKAQGLIGNEDGEFADQEKLLVDGAKNSRPKVQILRISHGVVAVYSLFKIVQAIL